jgi:hypothetical protein
MAEIKIEKKKGVPVWALLLGLVLLALIIWAVLTMRDRDRQNTPRDVAALKWTAAVVLELPAASAQTPFAAALYARCA